MQTPQRDLRSACACDAPSWPDRRVRTSRAAYTTVSIPCYSKNYFFNHRDTQWASAVRDSFKTAHHTGVYFTFATASLPQTVKRHAIKHGGVVSATPRLFKRNTSMHVARHSTGKTPPPRPSSLVLDCFPRRVVGTEVECLKRPCDRGFAKDGTLYSGNRAPYESTAHPTNLCDPSSPPAQPTSHMGEGTRSTSVTLLRRQRYNEALRQLVHQPHADARCVASVGRQSKPSIRACRRWHPTTRRRTPASTVDLSHESETVAKVNQYCNL